MSEDEVEVGYTAAEDWPDEDDDGEDMVLPSGAKVRVAPPPIVWLGMTGQLPAHIMAIAKHHNADKQDWSDTETRQAVEWLIAASFVSPRVSLGRKAGCLPLARISDRDKEAVVMKLRIADYTAALK